MLSNSRITLCAGFGLALVFLFSLPSAWYNLSELKVRQIVSVSQLIEWKNSYRALLPVNDRFVSEYPSGEEAKDLVALYRMLDVEKHGLVADVDTVRQTSASTVEVNGMHVGLQRLCLSNGGDGMLLSASTIKELRSGLKALSKRKDIDIGTIKITITDGTAVAEIKGMCLKVRTDKVELAAEV